jgi:hypothetical protein
VTVTRDGGSDQRKAGAVRKPKPKDHGGIGLNNDGALDVVAPGDLARRIAERDAEEADEPAAGRSHLMSKILPKPPPLTIKIHLHFPYSPLTPEP